MARDTSKLRVCSVQSNLHGYRTQAGNRFRVEAARAVLAWAATDRIDLVVFPAGYLHSRSSRASSVHAAAASLLQAAREANVAVVAGVDACDPEFRVYDPTHVEMADVPHHLVAWSPDSKSVLQWRQRSTTSNDARSLPEKAAAEVRVLVVGRTLVGVLASGEGFNPTLRENLAAAKPALAVIPAHVAGGIRHWQALGWLAAHGVPALRAVHADEAENVLWTGKTKQAPQATKTFTIDELALEVALFSLRR